MIPSVNAPQQIQAYGGGAFRVSGTRYRGSILIYAQHTATWSAATVEDISAAEVAGLVADAIPGTLVIIGCGATFLPMPPALRERLSSAGVHAEWMDTGAACRTFSVLAGEGREVRAALLAVE